MSRRSCILLVVVAFAVPTTGCGEDTAPNAIAEQVSGVPVTRLCEDLATARSGDRETVERFDHGPLHDIADQVADVDRSIAADLLEAMAAVDVALAEGATTTELADQLEAVIEATIAANIALGVPETTGCEETTP